MAKSILQPNGVKECFFTGRTDNLELHHIFFGTANRKVSDREGFFVFLSNEYHTGSSHSVHQSRAMDLMLKQDCQMKYEEKNSRESFVRLIGRNYLDDGIND